MLTRVLSALVMLALVVALPGCRPEEKKASEEKAMEEHPAEAQSTETEAPRDHPAH